MKNSILALSIASLLGGRLAAAPDAPASTSTTHLDEVVVTASPFQRSAADSAQPVSVLAGKNLKLKLGPTLGDTLQGEPGVAGSGFTAGASRPIIRGLDNNRIRVLNNGVEVFDVSNLSPDHAPSVNPLISQSVEVVRGTATILYGSGAIGGVVNVVDNRIPVEIPVTRFSGELDSRFNSADLERSGAGSFNLALTKNIVLHLDGTILRTDDVAIPGFALDSRMRKMLSPEQRARGNRFGGDPHGIVPNTRIFTRDFGVGLSFVNERGFIGASFSQLLSEYGVPDDPEVDDPVVPPDPVHLDVRKRQLNVRGGLKDPLPGFTNLDAKFVYTNYRHDEVDGTPQGDVIGSTFKTSGIDSRLELVHQPISIFEGSVGAQVFYKQLSVLGAGGAFLQPTRTTQVAGFIFEEVKLDPVRLQVGVRVEHQSTSINTDDPALTSLTSASQKNRDFTPVSAALGGIYDFAQDYALAITGSYSERAPTSEELFARGSHDATFQFLIGDPNLPKEKELGIDVSLRKKAGIVTGSLSAYYNRFSDFIDFNSTDAFENGLRVFNYTPKKADFYGGEALVDFHFLPRSVTVPAARGDAKSVRSIVAKDVGTDSAPNPHDLYLEIKGDYVHAKDRATGELLPRITPLRYSGALVYQGEKVGARMEVQRVNRQNRTAEFETETPGYTFLNASFSYTFGSGPVTYDLYLRGTNLTNQEARDHNSFLKEVLPLPGRSILVGLKASF